MKIYPGTHSVVQTDNVDLNLDIPLAYINTEVYDYKFTPIAVSGFDSDIKDRAIPYEEFDSLNVTLYDETGQPLKDILQRNGSKYKYVPKNAVTFNPQRFNYSVVGKKILNYKTNSTYNISAACIDDPVTLSFSRLLMKVFGDAPTRNVAPQNVWINNKDINVYSLTQGSISSKDFLFIESFEGLYLKNYWAAGVSYSKDQTVDKEGLRYICISDHTSSDEFNTDIGKWIKILPLQNAHYAVGDFMSYYGVIYSCITEHDATTFIGSYWQKYSVKDMPITIDAFMSVHTNIWLSVDNYYMSDIQQTTANLTLTAPQLYQTKTYTSPYTFTNSMIPADTEFKISKLFDEGQGNIMLMEYPKKGYVAVTHKSFLSSIETNVNLFYEALAYIYFNTYIETSPINEWITDVVPDYVITNNKFVQKDKFTSSMDLPKMFGLNAGEVILADIKIDTENIKFVNISNNFIVFQKLCTGAYQKYADPLKPTGGISVFTPAQDIMYYTQFAYKVEDSIINKVSVNKQDNKYYLVIDSLQSSSYGISTTPTAIEINLTYTISYQQISITNALMYLCCKDNILTLVLEDNYTLDAGIIIMKLNISQTKNDMSVIDMRQRGGGLPETAADNYDLLDIGAINGRAYRPTGAVVITLPKRLEVYEDMLLKSLRKHMVAEEYPIILFEDGDE